MVSLNEPAAGLVVVGVTGEGLAVGELDGEGAALGVGDGVGLTLAAVFWPAHPVAMIRAASNTAESRTCKA
jgi:hypothetical protein